MSNLELIPVGGGRSIEVPLSTTIIGRGPFLGVGGKTVSRHHASLHVGEDGNLILTPTHTMPCYYRLQGTRPSIALSQNKPQVLVVGDEFGLLRCRYYFRIAQQTEDYLHAYETNPCLAEEGSPEGHSECRSTPMPFLRSILKPIMKGLHSHPNYTRNNSNGRHVTICTRDFVFDEPLNTEIPLVDDFRYSSDDSNRSDSSSDSEEEEDDDYKRSKNGGRTRSNTKKRDRSRSR